MSKRIAYDALWLTKHFMPMLVHACLGHALAVLGLFIATRLWRVHLLDAPTAFAFVAHGGYYLAGACCCAYFARQCRRELARR